MALKNKKNRKKSNQITSKCILQRSQIGHQSVTNFVGNLAAGLIACNLAPKKSALNLEIIDLGAIKNVA
jgi:hypothetical protein